MSKTWKKLKSLLPHAPLRDENAALLDRVAALKSENAKVREENASLLVLVRALRDVNEHLDKRLLGEGK